MEVYSKVICMEGTQEGKMFSASKFSFEDLLTWVYRNCPGERKIVVEKNHIQVHYDERVEIYYFKKLCE